MNYKTFLVPLSFLDLGIIVVQAYITFNNSGTSVNIPTYSFFEYKSPFFAVEGPSVEMPIISIGDETNCSIVYNLTQYNHSSPKPPPPPPAVTDETTIVYLDYAGSTCSFGTFSNTFRYFYDFRKYLTKLGYPKAETLFLLREPYAKPFGDIGNPSADFGAFYVSDDEKPPPSWLKVQMADVEDAAATINLFRQHNGAIVRVVQEPGPWNQIFLSFWFRGLVWLLISMMSIVVLLSFYFVYVSYLDQVLTFSLKYVVYFLTLIDSIVYLAIMSLPLKTLASFILDSIHVLLITWAFHLLLLLWSTILDNLELFRYNYIFRWGILASLSICTFQRIYTLAILSNTTLITSTFTKWLNIFYAATQFLLSLCFLVYAYLFYLKLKDIRQIGNSNKSADILKTLSGIAIIGFVCYFFIAMENVLIGIPNLAIVGAVDLVLMHIINLSRTISILTIITLREPALEEREKTWLETKLTTFECKLTVIWGANSGTGSIGYDYNSTISNTNNGETLQHQQIPEKD